MRLAALLVVFVACSNPDKALSSVRGAVDAQAGLCAAIERRNVEMARLGRSPDSAESQRCLDGLSQATARHREACEAFYDPYTCRREQEDIIRRAEVQP